MMAEGVSELELCGKCGCPRAVHIGGLWCVHCESTGGVCTAFISRENVDIILIDKDILVSGTVIMLIAGVLIGWSVPNPAGVLRYITLSAGVLTIMIMFFIMRKL